MVAVTCRQFCFITTATFGTEPSGGVGAFATPTGLMHRAPQRCPLPCQLHPGLVPREILSSSTNGRRPAHRAGGALRRRLEDGPQDNRLAIQRVVDRQDAVEMAGRVLQELGHPRLELVPPCAMPSASR